jgi:uncharacterized protein YqgV (UPF0045/DUF77 family)
MTDKKEFDELTVDELKDLKIEFAPGCFDNFEGTQEELDELIAEIHRMFSSGEVHKNTRKLDLDDLSDEDFEALAKYDAQEERGRKLQ